MLDDKWRYAVNLVNEKTGEQQTVVVTLTDAERDHAIRNSAHTGGPDGPIVKAYAMGHAKAGIPPGTAIEIGEIQRVTVH